jgi:hypothetical protein
MLLFEVEVQVHKEGESTLAVLKKQVRMISDPQRG